MSISSFSCLVFQLLVVYMLDHCPGTCRAKFITGTVQALLAKPGGGRQWLYSLRNVPYKEASEALCELPGIGPKVGIYSQTSIAIMHVALS